MPERDEAAVRRGGRPSGSVPLVQLDDPGYEGRPHLVLTDDAERQTLARVVHREDQEAWREGLITRQDRRQARLWAAVVGVAALGGLVLSAADLLLHLLR